MTQTLDGALKRAEPLARLHEHALLLTRMQRLLGQLIGPALAAHSRVVQWQDGLLTLHADNNALAARLRQSLPTIAEGFSAQGWPVSQVAVKVRPRPAEPQPPPVPQRTLPASAATRLAQLQASLPDDSPLREALARLLAEARR